MKKKKKAVQAKRGISGIMGFIMLGAAFGYGVSVHVENYRNPMLQFVEPVTHSISEQDREQGLHILTDTMTEKLNASVGWVGGGNADIKETPAQ